MTPRERAGAIIDRWNLDAATIGRTSILQSEMVDVIEQAIIAAVEEEREACAKICDEEAARIHNHYADFPRELVKEIRARLLSLEDR